MENIERIQLLSSTEVEELYARPEFNTHEQSLYFSLSPTERAALEQFRNTQTRIHFILQLGYFKAKQQFFNYSLDEVVPMLNISLQPITTVQMRHSSPETSLVNIRVSNARRYCHFSTTEAGRLNLELK